MTRLIGSLFVVFISCCYVCKAERFFFTIEKQFVEGSRQPQDSTQQADARIVEISICENPDRYPYYIGGPDSLISYMMRSIHYPREAIEQDIQGKVRVRFVIDEKGRVILPKVVQSVHPLLDAQAVKVVKEMPSWLPASFEGKPVAVYYTLPVYFNLKEE